MTDSKKRGITPNAVKLSLEAKHPSPTFDPSRFGEIEITAELRAKLLSLYRETLDDGRAVKHRDRDHPREEQNRSVRVRLAQMGGLVLLAVLAATIVWQLLR